MLIQPKRWVVPTAGALLVFLVLGMLWGRQNPEQFERMQSKLPQWKTGGQGGSSFEQTPPPAGLPKEVAEMYPSSSTQMEAETTSTGGFNFNPMYTEGAIAEVPADHAIDDMIPGSSTTTSERGPFDGPKPTTTAPAFAGHESSSSTSHAALGGGPLGGPAAPSSTSHAVQGGGAPVLDADGYVVSSSAQAAAPSSTGKVLEPIVRPHFTPKAGQKKISDDHPNGTHNVIRSKSTADGKYFVIDFWGIRSYNPNLVPHPIRNDTWVVTTQRWKGPEDNQVWFTQLVCEVKWKNDTMACTESPLILPVQASLSEKCVDDLVFFNFNVGPHDARAFFGPDAPFLVYGTQSQFTCFGQYIQDLRVLTDWAPFISDAPFRFPTELQRPDSYGPVEKNWFIFWDSKKDMYIHYDVKPHRVFAKLNADGSVGKDLGVFTREKDDECLARHTANVEESVRKSLHQATNSLAVTLCRRSDPNCKPTDDNTFILSIFQQKSYIAFHGIYEPYVMLFRRNAPFDTYAFGKKPIWTMGRNMPGELSWYREIPADQSEMVYLTSLNWKERGLNYHGYLDDVIFVGFGVEDTAPAIIDVTAGDLIGDLLYC